MADKGSSKLTPTPTPVTAPLSTPQPSNVVVGGPGFWVKKLRPTDTTTHDERLKQVHFDAYFAGAKAANKWEDEWPVLDEKAFLKHLKEVAELELGGQWPDQVHFSKDGRGSPKRPTAKAEE